MRNRKNTESRWYYYYGHPVFLTGESGGKQGAKYACINQLMPIVETLPNNQGYRVTYADDGTVIIKQCLGKTAEYVLNRTWPPGFTSNTWVNGQEFRKWKRMIRKLNVTDHKICLDI